MALFCATLKRKLSFSLKISLSQPCSDLLVWDFVCLSLEISIHLFFFPFLFPSLCFFVCPYLVSIVTVISLSFTFFNAVLEFSYWCINTIFNAGGSFFFLLFFIHIICYFLLLACKALRIVINFLVLWSIYQSSSLIHFKNGPEYFTRGTAKVFIPLTRFLLQSSVSRSLSFLRQSFLIFSFISVCLMVSVSNIPKYM